MVATIGKGTVAQYYLRRTEYYLTGHEPAGVWLSTSAALGIAVGQTVEADLFEKLHAGLGSDGEPLSAGGRKQRVSGYDLTLSAPKSVSILFALADDETRAAIERVQLEAAQAVITILNQEAAFTRRGHNGVVIEKASLIVAAFQHGEARPAAHSDGRVFADMDLHSHLCIANIVENLTEKSGALSDNRKRYSAVDGRAIYAHKMLAGSVYHLALSAGLQKLGFDVAVTGTNGIFEVVKPGSELNNPELAVDAGTKVYFSARRSKIEQILAEYDLVTGEAQPLAAAVGKATRLSKSDSDMDRFQLWREIATERGIRYATFAQDLRTDRRLTDRQREALIGERLAQVPLALTEQESVFERRTLLAAVASALVGTGVDPDRVNVEVERIISSKQIVALGQDIYGHGLYSTPEMIAIEKRLQVTAQKMADRKWTALDPEWVKSKCSELGLSEEQQNAALAATDQSAICVISGAAGSGKTHTLGVVVQGYGGGGKGPKGASVSKKILGAAISWRTAEMLHESLGIETFSVDSLLAQIQAGKPLLDRNTVLLLDECGQIGSRAMDRLLTAVANAQSKVVFIGDVEQLQPINAGPALKILTSIIEPARIEKIVRQRETWAQDAARAFAKGNAAAGLAMYTEHDLISECAGAKATIVTAVDEYRAAQQAAPHLPHLLIAKSNKTVRALNAELRLRMRDEGVLTGPDYALAAGDSSGRAFKLFLAVGDRIRFGIRQDMIGNGVINGTVGTVQEITEEADGHLTIMATIDGNNTTFSTRQLLDKSGRARLGHNLAVTAYSSQGLTAETATVILDKNFDRHSAYVAMSRARGTTRICYDLSLADVQDDADRPFDEKGEPASSASRLAFLSGYISRANLKTSTLALTESAVLSKDVGGRGKERKQERAL